MIFFSNTLAGFVKSQEGENEEGNEGELVVKFVSLPKVVYFCTYFNKILSVQQNSVFKNIYIIRITNLKQEKSDYKRQ